MRPAPTISNDPALAGGTPIVTWNATNKTLTIAVDDGVTTVNQVNTAINNATGSNDLERPRSCGRHADRDLERHEQNADYCGGRWRDDRQSGQHGHQQCDRLQ